MILNVKETAISENIIYHTSDEKYTKDIFTQQTIQGKQGVDAMKVGKHLYDYVGYPIRRRKRNLSNGWKHQKRLRYYVKLPEDFIYSLLQDVICGMGDRFVPGNERKTFLCCWEKSQGKDKDSNQ